MKLPNGNGIDLQVRSAARLLSLQAHTARAAGSYCLVILTSFCCKEC